MWEMQFQLANLKRWPSCPVPGFSTKNLKSLRRWSQVITRSRPSWSGVMFLLGIFFLTFISKFFFLILLHLFFLSAEFCFYSFLLNLSWIRLTARHPISSSFNLLLMLWWTLNLCSFSRSSFSILVQQISVQFWE